MYDSFEAKQELERQWFKKLFGEEALVQALNLMDFMAALIRRKNVNSEKIEWIVLEIKN